MSGKSSAALSTTATSPFTCLPTAQLTPSGLLSLDSQDGEVELLRRHGDLLQIRSESAEPLSSHPSYKDRMDLSNIVLTTHRLVLSSPSSEKRFLHLSNIHACEAVSTSVFSSHCKIRISTYSLGELILVLPKKDTILPTLEKTLERRAWETASRLQQSKAATAVSKRRVGVDAILASQQRKHERASQLTDQAFTGDVETLLKEATELVAIIQKYASTLDNSSNKSDKQEEDKMAEMLSDMGMTSSLAVSEKSALYYETLARQVADFILPKLEKQGLLMISLTDLYCIYNRARGSNLISPSDLLAAVERLDKIPEIPLSLKTFSSGVKVVVQTNDYNAEKLGTQLKELCVNGVTALEASRLLKLSAMLAQEALLEAEKQGYLCRDVTLETTRFYTNKFPEFALESKR